MEFGTKIVKVILESHVERVGQICTDCLGGGRMVMAKSLFTIVLAVGKLRGEFTNLCRFFWNLLRISVRRRTLNVELVLALRALLRGTLASETHTHGKKNTQKKKDPSAVPSAPSLRKIREWPCAWYCAWSCK